MNDSFTQSVVVLARLQRTFINSSVLSGRLKTGSDIDVRSNVCSTHDVDDDNVMMTGQWNVSVT